MAIVKAIVVWMLWIVVDQTSLDCRGDVYVVEWKWNNNGKVRRSTEEVG
jgi:hypothetical protein